MPIKQKTIKCFLIRAGKPSTRRACMVVKLLSSLVWVQQLSGEGHPGSQRTALNTISRKTADELSFENKMRTWLESKSLILVARCRLRLDQQGKLEPSGRLLK